MLKKDYPQNFYVKTSFEDDDFRLIEMSRKRKSKVVDFKTIRLTQAYASNLKLTENKMADMQDLVKMLTF